MGFWGFGTWFWDLDLGLDLGFTIKIKRLSTYLLKLAFGSILPMKGETMKTVSSNIPNTKPYSVALAPFLSASAG